MRQKNTEKHTEKKSNQKPSSKASGDSKSSAPKLPPQATDLFEPPSGSKPIEHAYATAPQLAAEFPFAAIDDAMLRRRANETNPATGAPWIPKPRGAKYHVADTIRGLWAWAVWKLADADILPRQCASMKDFAAIYRQPMEEIKFVRENGLAPKAFDAANRVNVLDYFAGVCEFHRNIVQGNYGELKNMPGLEEWDKDREQAKLARENRIAQSMENAREQKILHTREGIEELLGEPLMQLGIALKKFPKETGGKIKSILASANVPEEIIRQTIATANAGADEPLEIIRSQLPFAVDVPGQFDAKLFDLQELKYKTVIETKRESQQPEYVI